MVKQTRYEAVKDIVDTILDGPPTVETQDGLQCSAHLANKLNIELTKIIQLAKDENFDHIRLVGMDEARTRITKCYLATICQNLPY